MGCSLGRLSGSTSSSMLRARPGCRRINLMDGRRGDVEVTLHVALGRRATVEQAVGPDEGEILSLLFGEAGSRRRLSVK
jgi:hypothetical protein